MNSIVCKFAQNYYHVLFILFYFFFTNIHDFPGLWWLRSTPTPFPPRPLHCLHFADVEKKTVQNHSVLAEQIYISCADVITINVSPGQRKLRPLTWKWNSAHVFESFTGTFFLSCMINVLPPPPPPPPPSPVSEKLPIFRKGKILNRRSKDWVLCLVSACWLV